MARPAGSKNKTTLEREAQIRLDMENREREASAAVATDVMARVPAKKLGKDILDDFANLYAGLAAYFQPWPESRGKNPSEDIAKFNYYSERATVAAGLVAPFQSPRLSAVAIGAAIINQIQVTGGMPDDFVPPVKDGQVIELKAGQVLSPSDFKPNGPKDGTAAA